MKKRRLSLFFFFAVLVSLFMLSASRVDPLRSVSAIRAKPNTLLVVDLSGSMLCDLNQVWPDGLETCCSGGGNKCRTCNISGAAVGEDWTTGDWVEEINPACTTCGGGGSSCADGVVNGTFETGDTTGWSGTATVNNLGACNGAFGAKFGGAKGSNQTLQQTVTIPPSCIGLTLKFTYKVTGGGSNKDKFYYNINGGTTQTITDGKNNKACTNVTSACLDSATKPITIKFWNTNSKANAIFYLDDVSLSGTGTSCSGGGSTVTAYRWRWHNPSRLAIIKNILGNAITLYEADVTDPQLAPPVGLGWDATRVPKPTYQPPQTQINPQSLVLSNYNYLNFGIAGFSCFGCHTLYDPMTWELGSGSGGGKCATCDHAVCSDEDANNNGYGDISGDDKVPLYNPPYGTILTDAFYNVLNGINVNDDPTVQYNEALTINNKMILVSQGGLAHYTATPVDCAFCGTKNYFANLVDPYGGICGRKNYVIFINDGRDTGAKCTTWSSPWGNVSCGTPTSEVQALWNMGIKVFVIGLSTEVTQDVTALDALNEWAFYGGTDAQDPYGGISTDYPDPEVYNPPTKTTPTAGRTYAYLAENSQQLSNALQNIIASIATVDMATGQPVVTSTSSGFSGNTDIGILTSSDFPDSFGHIRLFDLTDTANPVEKWDAGDMLLSRNLTSDPRKVYTSDPVTNSLVTIDDTPASAATLSAMSGISITQDMIKFILGKDVTDINGVVHSKVWRLGDMVNATPAIISSPPSFPYLGGQGHSNFAINYKNRQPVLIQGANDLMIHFIDIVDGYELYAYMPPNLIAKIATLYGNWVASGYERMGQPLGTLEHIYGISSSVRLTDIKDPTKILPASDQGWRSIAVISEGAGGKAVVGLDVTHLYPGRNIGGTNYPADPNYSASSPFEVLWYKKDTDLQDLGETWSIPVVGYSKDNLGAMTFVVVLGSAYGTLNQGKHVYMLNAADGSIIKKTPASPLANRVGSKVTDNYYFASTAGYSDQGTSGDSQIISAYNLDLNGQVWDWVTSSAPLPDATTTIDVTAGQPLYYAPAVGGTTRSGTQYRIMALNSGTYDETDPNVNNTPNPFIPNLYISVKTSTGAWQTVSKSVDTIDKGGGTFLNASTRPSSPPLLLIPAAGDVTALYLVYDPTKSAANCYGESYVVVVTFDPANLGSAFPGTISVFDAGAGKASGFSVVGTQVVVGTSGTGGQEASIKVVPNVTVPKTGATIGVSAIKDFGY